MFSKALLSLLSPLHSLAGAHENKAVVAHHKHTAPAWIIAGANRPQQQGKECVLTKRKWMGHRPRRRLISPKLEDEKDGHDTKPDVGILGRRQKKCIPDKEVCEADASSSLGGRCVPTASSSSTTTSRKLSEETELCYFKCPDPKVCKCHHNGGSGYSAEECTESTASACRNGDIEKCFPNEIIYFKGLLCPRYACMDDGKAYSECRTVSYAYAYDKFCRDHLDEWKDAENNATICHGIVEYASLFNNSYYVEYLTNPNTVEKKKQLIMERFDECVKNSSSSEDVYAHGHRCQCQMNSAQCEQLMRLHAGGYYAEYHAQQSNCQVANCCNTTAPTNLAACFDVGSYNGAYTSAPESAEPTSQTSDEPLMKESYPPPPENNGSGQDKAEPTSQPSDEPPMKESYPPPPENNGSGQDKSSSACRSIKSSLALTLVLANAIGFLSFIFK